MKANQSKITSFQPNLLFISSWKLNPVGKCLKLVDKLLISGQKETKKVND